MQPPSNIGNLRRAGETLAEAGEWQSAATTLLAVLRAQLHPAETAAQWLAAHAYPSGSDAALFLQSLQELIESLQRLPPPPHSYTR